MAKRIEYSMNIVTLDLEVTTVVSNDGKKWQKFNPVKADNDENYLDTLHRQSVMYIWGVTINGEFYHGRTFDELRILLNNLSSKEEITVIYCHNLSYEFQFLRNILTFTEVFSRKKRKLMKATTDNNLEFRCSYMLTGQSLENSAKTYSKLEKLKGSLDYSKIRHENTPILDEELAYLKHDCLITHDIIKAHIEEYGDMKGIPITATSKVRKRLKEQYTKQDFNRIAKNKETDYNHYKWLKQAFMGGYTHANALHVGKELEGVSSWDITSSYPAQMIIKKFPIGAFKEVDLNYYNYKFKENVAQLLDVVLINFKSKSSNNYISYSKCYDVINPMVDNGRIYKAEQARIRITDIDFEIIKRNYDIERIVYIAISKAPKRRLPPSMVRFIAKSFTDKQVFKGVEGREEEYKIAKETINSLYGMSVTDLVGSEIGFTENEWTVDELTDETGAKRLTVVNGARNETNLFAWGAWITAYAREALWLMIEQIGDDVVYCDTDSIKFLGNHEDKFKEYNAKFTNYLNENLGKEDRGFIGLIERELQSMKIDTLGEYDNELLKEPNYTYKKFKTLGAKKYAYTLHSDGNDELHITVAGVPKKQGAKTMEKIENFNIGYTWSHENSGKNLIAYNDNQEEIEVTDYLGNTIKVNQKYGTAITPTSYKLGISKDYERYIELMESWERKNGATTNSSWETIK